MVTKVGDSEFRQKSPEITIFDFCFVPISVLVKAKISNFSNFFKNVFETVLG